MQDWNLVLTSHMYQERRLLEELASQGEFRPTGFTAVLLGRVPDVPAFLDYLRGRWLRQAYVPTLLSRVVPVRRVFAFTPEDLAARIIETASEWLPEIGDAPFYVRMQRRGYKGVISSQAVEQAVDQALVEACRRWGRLCRIDFAAAEYIVAVQTVHTQCGVGLISRGMQETYPFIRLT